MRETAEALKEKLGRFWSIFEKQPLLSISQEEKNRLRSEAGSLLKKVEALQESYLFLGLLGGTGVGKSTLMNALAGEKISSTSHRRPHTDHILIYRHRSAKRPQSINLKNLLWHEITHEADGIQPIFLCDLPDFDSFEGEHEEQVQLFLGNLDVLIWVTSPEKYADKRFYDFLKSTPKSKKNFLFVLNKADLLFQEQSLEDGYQRMAQVSERFQQHVRANDTPDPTFYVISAEEALSEKLSPWNQFLSFRQQIFQQRDMKQIAAIKAANLDVEIYELLNVFEEEMRNLVHFKNILDRSLAEIVEQRPEWDQSAQTAINWWTGAYIRKKRFLVENLPSILIGPGYGFALLAGLFDDRIKTEQGGVGLTALGPPEEVKVSFQAQISWIKERIKGRLLKENLSGLFYDRLEQRVGMQRAYSDMAGKALEIMEEHLVKKPMPAFRLFKARQYAAYFALLFVLVISVIDKADWYQFLGQPGLNSFFQLIVSGIHTLFSGKGLAALLSYTILNLFLALRFYRSHKKQLRRVNRKMMKKLKKELLLSWNHRLESILVDLGDYRGEIQQQIEALKVLKGGTPELDA